MLNKIVRGLLVGALAFAGTSAAVSTPVHAAAKTYKNCTALNKVYKHGVGKKGAKDKVRGSTKKVTNFKVSNALYKANKKSDRDKDGIACEKR
ncbi:excalibur calcium-binding domain-containing protein [Actinoplanes sp. NPDC049668]|uniref:excalibur calcium-binding domain-containing protein n=1 Tax=unclassified Actinoplanes TaxID=2626549 RepID=UPI0033B90664